MNSRIGIVMATMLEAKPLIESLHLALKTMKPFHIYENERVVLAISGIGKVNAALSTAYVIGEYDFKALYNLGAAGGLKSGIKKGAIFHISDVIDYDRPLLRGGTRKTAASTCEGFDLAVLATTDRPAISLERRLDIGREADLVDMEGSGFVQACKIFGAEPFLWKIVSDALEDNNTVDIVENIKYLIKELCIFFEEKILK
ncbi:MAG TPA: hypothetical protein PK104_12075 [Spirochaetota bacterium]|jgi:nucleoside phosphorylase|nr:hypothetical protein [Spirochaetota bacterium]HPX90662.1 hypothetical protein [Spirochaetota bacterium]